MSVKIAIIGAGSAVFSLNLIRDLSLTPGLRGSTVCLMDIDRGRLDAISSLCQRYASEVGTQFNLLVTTDRRAALDGADFVVNAALTAGHDRLRDGWAVAQRLGYRFGGSYHVMHDEAFWINFYQLRLFESIIKDVLTVCPSAWYLQVANPVLAGVTYLTRLYPEARIVGLCHGFASVYHLADVLGLDRSSITFEIPGVNHFVWLTHFYHKGQNVFPLLDRWITRDAPSYWERSGPSSDLGPKACDLYQRFGVFPIGDTCTPGGGAWPWWYHVNDEVESQWQESPAAWWERHFQRGQESITRIREVASDTSRAVTQSFPPKASGEVIVPIIDSIANDVPRVIIANIANAGDFVPGVPRDFAVEIPTLVSKRGVQGIRTNGLPDPLLAYIWRDRVAPVNLEIEAYRKRSRELLLQLLVMDPWTSSEHQARRLLQGIFDLPYHAELNQHYQ